MKQAAQAISIDVGRVIGVVGTGVDAGLYPGNVTIL